MEGGRRTKRSDPSLIEFVEKCREVEETLVNEYAVIGESGGMREVEGRAP